MQPVISPGVPIFRLCEELVTHRIDGSLQKLKGWEQTKRSIRLQSLDVLFMFQRGPHKFLHGSYPRVTDTFTKRLLNIVLVVIRKHKGEKYAQLVLRSVHQLGIALHPNLLAFLLLTSNIQQNIDVLGAIRIPEQHCLVNDRDDSVAPKYTTFQTSAFLCSNFYRFDYSVLSNHLTYPNKSETFNFSQSDSNLFTSVLHFRRRFSLASHFFGAFSHAGSDAQRLLVTRGSAPLRLPPLCTDSHKMSFSSFDLIHTSTHEDKDEGYSDSSDRPKRPACLNDVDARQFLRNLFASATEGILDFVLTEVYPSFDDADPHLYSFKPVLLKTTPKTDTGRFLWTNRGFTVSSKELPFLTESGPWGSLALFITYSQRFSSISSLPHDGAEHSSSLIATPCALLNDLGFMKLRSDFFRDLLFLRMGVQSSRFVWDLPSNKEQHNHTGALAGQFRYCNGPFDAVILGISESALNNYIQIHLVSGTFYRHLCWFARRLIPFTPVPGQMWRGSTWACFVHAVSTWLSWYEEALQLLLQQHDKLTEPGDIAACDLRSHGLLKFHKRLHLLTTRVSFVYEVCMLDANNCPLLQLSGIELLVYLASKCTQSLCNPNESIARFLFLLACQPFLGFLETLLLDGVPNESGGDFNFSIATWSLSKRDAAFWTDSFRFSPVQPSSSPTTGFTELLPVDFQKHVLRCAKSVHLLKLIDPNHFIFKTRTQFPGLQLYLSHRESEEQHQAIFHYLEILWDSVRQARSTWLQRQSEAVFQQQTILKRSMEARTLHLAAFDDHLSDSRRPKLKEALSELDQAAQIATDCQLPRGAEIPEYDACLNVLDDPEPFEKEVTTGAKKKSEVEHDILTKKANLDKLEADKRLKQNRLVNAVFSDRGLKTEEFRTDHPFASITSEEKLNALVASQPSLIAPTNTTTVLTTITSQSPAVASSLGRVSVLPEFVSSPTCRAKSDSTPNSPPYCHISATGDPPSKVYRGSQHRACSSSARDDQVRSPLYSDEPVVHTFATGAYAHNLAEPIVSFNSTPTHVCDSVARFRERIARGHSSNSTVQNMLYGTGSGPACRPSTWEAQRAVWDAEDSAKLSKQPDANAFYREALESGSDTGSLVFTMAFPDCDQPSFVDPLRSTRRSVPLVDSVSQNTPAPRSAHSASLKLIFDKAIILPLTSYMRLVDMALCDFFLYNTGLLEHFNCLRHVCFLEHSEFCALLLDGLFQQATGPLTEQSKLYDATFLHDLMQSTTSKFLASADETVNLDQVHFWTPDCTSLTIRASIDLVPSKRESDSKRTIDNVPLAPSFDHITLVYKAPWPLNIVINNRVMGKYNLILKQLLHVKFAVWLLTKVYRWIRQNLHSYRPRTSSLSDVHTIILWFHEMNQVLRGLEAYLTNQAVKVNWAKFIARVTGSLEASQPPNWNALLDPSVKRVAHLDDLMDLHDMCLSNIIKCCLLDPANQELQQVFHGLLSCVHWFYKVLCSGSWVPATRSVTPDVLLCHSGWDQLHASHQSFRQHARFLRRRIGRLLTTPGADHARRHLSPFLLALGLNDFYGQSQPLSIPTPNTQLQYAHCYC